MPPFSPVFLLKTPAKPANRPCFPLLSLVLFTSAVELLVRPGINFPLEEVAVFVMPLKKDGFFSSLGLPGASALALL
jgi:hypothetical protein